VAHQRWHLRRLRRPHRSQSDPRRSGTNSPVSHPLFYFLSPLPRRSETSSKSADNDNLLKPAATVGGPKLSPGGDSCDSGNGGSQKKKKPKVQWEGREQPQQRQRHNVNRNRDVGSSFRFCDVSGQQLLSAFDDSTSNDEDLGGDALIVDAATLLDTNLRRTQSADDVALVGHGGIGIDGGGLRQKRSFEEVGFRGPAGGGDDAFRRSTVSETDTSMYYCRPTQRARSFNSRSFPPADFYYGDNAAAVSSEQPPIDDLMRQVSSEVQSRSYRYRHQNSLSDSTHDRFSSRVTSGSDVSVSAYQSCNISDPFEERINRVLGPTTADPPTISHPPFGPSTSNDLAPPVYQRATSAPVYIGSRPSNATTVPVPTSTQCTSIKQGSSPSKGTPRREDLVDQVGKDDVLLGRGPLVYQHEGNQRFHDEKKKMQQDYLSAPNTEKKNISQKLVDKINEKGKFLSFDTPSGKWYKVTNDVARAKAAQALREAYTREDRRHKREKYKMRLKSKTGGDNADGSTVRSHTPPAPADDKFMFDF